MLSNYKSLKFLWSLTYQLFGLIFGMFRVEVRPRALLISALMWEGILPLLEKLIWTLVFHNIKIVGNRNTPPCLVEFKGWNVSSVMVLKNLKIIINSDSTTKPTEKPTHYALKQKKANYVHILSSAPTTMAITRWTLTFFHSGNTDLITNGTTKNTSRSMKTS